MIYCQCKSPFKTELQGNCESASYRNSFQSAADDTKRISIDSDPLPEDSDAGMAKSSSRQRCHALPPGVSQSPTTTPSTSTVARWLTVAWSSSLRRTTPWLLGSIRRTKKLLPVWARPVDVEDCESSSPSNVPLIEPDQVALFKWYWCAASPAASPTTNTSLETRRARGCR